MKNLLGILGQGVISGAASYGAAGNHDLRMGFGRKEGETMPLWRDIRVLGGIGGTVLALTTRGQVAKLSEEAARGLVSSVTSTEAVRMRAIQAAKQAEGEGVTIEIPAAKAG